MLHAVRPVQRATRLSAQLHPSPRLLHSQSPALPLSFAITHPLSTSHPRPQSRTLSTTAPHHRSPIAVPTSSPPPPPIPQPPPDYDSPSPDTLTNLTPLPDLRSISARRALLLVSLPIPPSSWPSHLDAMSPLIGLAGKRNPNLAVIGAYDGAGEAGWPELRGEEVYPAKLVYNDGVAFHFPTFSKATLTSPEWTNALSYDPSSGSPAPPGSSTQPPEILICTHGARDCRCSEQGVPLLTALRSELSQDNNTTPIAVREVSHVGGHKWAANALVLPGLDMLSNLREGDAGVVLDFARGQRGKGYAHWRGRMGWSEERQRGFFQAVEAEPGREAVFRGSEAATAQAQVKEGGRSTEKEAKVEPASEKSPPVELHFRTFEGEDKLVPAKLGDTLLEVGKEHDLPSMEGMCGGNLECATCHLYLGEDAPVPEPGEDELDMLGYAVGYRDGSSRLGCQIEVTPELAAWCKAGGVIGLPRF